VLYGVVVLGVRLLIDFGVVLCVLIEVPVVLNDNNLRSTLVNKKYL
jgi:hypothetical protein